MKEMMGRREVFKPEEKVFKYRQSTHNENFLSEYVFPSVSHYPKGFNTRDTRGEQTDVPNTQFIKPIVKGSQRANTSNGPITGLQSKYRDPLTNTPFASKDAFKIIREKYFQKDEEKLFVRLQVLNDLLLQKRHRLKKVRTRDQI